LIDSLADQSLQMFHVGVREKHIADGAPFTHCLENITVAVVGDSRVGVAATPWFIVERKVTVVLLEEMDRFP